MRASRQPKILMPRSVAYSTSLDTPDWVILGT
jgi:hypothetical protein